MITVTGASGHLGRLAVQALIDSGVPAAVPRKVQRCCNADAIAAAWIGVLVMVVVTLRLDRGRFVITDEGSTPLQVSSRTGARSAADWDVLPQMRERWLGCEDAAIPG
jgi:hypothetical protein